MPAHHQHLGGQGGRADLLQPGLGGVDGGAQGALQPLGLVVAEAAFGGDQLGEEGAVAGQPLDDGGDLRGGGACGELGHRGVGVVHFGAVLALDRVGGGGDEAQRRLRRAEEAELRRVGGLQASLRLPLPVAGRILEQGGRHDGHGDGGQDRHGGGGQAQDAGPDGHARRSPERGGEDSRDPAPDRVARP